MDSINMIPQTIFFFDFFSKIPIIITPRVKYPVVLIVKTTAKTMTAYFVKSVFPMNRTGKESIWQFTSVR